MRTYIFAGSLFLKVSIQIFLSHSALRPRQILGSGAKCSTSHLDLNWTMPTLSWLLAPALFSSIFGAGLFGDFFKAYQSTQPKSEERRILDTIEPKAHMPSSSSSRPGSKHASHATHTGVMESVSVPGAVHVFFDLELKVSFYSGSPTRASCESTCSASVPMC